MNFDNPHFKSEFWRWFDNITPAERKKFKEYPADMAELFFYNKYFSKGIDPFERHKEYASVSASATNGE